jgi:hypothetical protein
MMGKENMPRLWRFKFIFTFLMVTMFIYYFANVVFAIDSNTIYELELILKEQNRVPLAGIQSTMLTSQKVYTSPSSTCYFDYDRIDADEVISVLEYEKYLPPVNSQDIIDKQFAQKTVNSILRFLKEEVGE